MAEELAPVAPAAGEEPVPLDALHADLTATAARRHVYALGVGGELRGFRVVASLNLIAGVHMPETATHWRDIFPSCAPLLQLFLRVAAIYAGREPTQAVARLRTPTAFRGTEARLLVETLVDGGETPATRRVRGFCLWLVARRPLHRGLVEAIEGAVSAAKKKEYAARDRHLTGKKQRPNPPAPAVRRCPSRPHALFHPP